MASTTSKDEGRSKERLERVPPEASQQTNIDLFRSDGRMNHERCERVQTSHHVNVSVTFVVIQAPPFVLGTSFSFEVFDPFILGGAVCSIAPTPIPKRYIFIMVFQGRKGLHIKQSSHRANESLSPS